MGYLSKIIPPKLKRYQFLECKKSLLEYWCFGKDVDNNEWLMYGSKLVSGILEPGKRLKVIILLTVYLQHDFDSKP